MKSNFTWIEAMSQQKWSDLEDGELKVGPFLIYSKIKYRKKQTKQSTGRKVVTEKVTQEAVPLNYCGEMISGKTKQEIRFRTSWNFLK